ncbi:MAG TPA: TetR/AcrR family transcriptional regulator [Actinomycetes bacterium]
MPTGAGTRTPQEERSRATRQRLLEATVDCLVERGWAGTTTTVIVERAGVSRGAQLHHYPTKSELVMAAVDHVGRARVAEVRDAATRLRPGRQRTKAVLDMLADFFTGPLFVAALELWVAARTDETMRAAVSDLEARLGRETHALTVELLGVDESRPGAREAVQATLDLVRGLGLANLLTDDRARRDRILRAWGRTLDETLGVVG